MAWPDVIPAICQSTNVSTSCTLPLSLPVLSEQRFSGFGRQDLRELCLLCWYSLAIVSIELDLRSSTPYDELRWQIPKRPKQSSATSM